MPRLRFSSSSRFSLVLLCVLALSTTVEAGCLSWLFGRRTYSRPYYAAYTPVTTTYAAYPVMNYQASYTPYTVPMTSQVSFNPIVPSPLMTDNCGCTPCCTGGCSVGSCPTGGCATGNCPTGNCALNYASPPVTPSPGTGETQPAGPSTFRRGDDTYGGGSLLDDPPGLADPEEERPRDRFQRGDRSRDSVDPDADDGDSEFVPPRRGNTEINDRTADEWREVRRPVAVSTEVGESLETVTTYHARARRFRVQARARFGSLRLARNAAPASERLEVPTKIAGR